MREVWIVIEMGSLRCGEYYADPTIFINKSEAKKFYDKLIIELTQKGYWIQNEDEDDNVTLLMNDDHEWVEISLEKRKIMDAENSNTSSKFSKFELSIFADLYEARQWIRDMEEKGYEVEQIDNNDNGALVILMKRDNLKLIERKMKAIEIEQKYGAYMSEEDREFIKKIKEQGA